jgi:hypothetical protein
MLLPVTGHPLHTRSLSVVIRHEADGHWDVRGDVVDLRKCGFVPMYSDIQPAGIIHLMKIGLGVDPQARRILSLETDQPFIAVEPTPTTGGECCRDPAPRLAEMVGEQLDAHFTKRLSLVFGGARGCSHLLTLFQLMASTLLRAFELEPELLARLGAPRPPGEVLFRRSMFIEGFETADHEIELAAQVGDFHSRPADTAAGPIERLAREDSVRAFTRLRRTDLSMQDLQAARRTRSAEDLAQSWRDEAEPIASLCDTPLIPGLAARLFGLLGAQPEHALLLDTLLQLAPTYIQVMAAVTDRWLAEGRPRAEDGSTSTASGSAMGGMVDSCYMWRSSGPLATRRHPN